MFPPFPFRFRLGFKRRSSRRVIDEFWDWEVLGRPGSATRAAPTVAQPERWTIDVRSVNFLCLPNEVISQIFYYACLPIPGDAEWRRQFYPLWLGRVCRAWRGIAWTTSELWTTIVLRVYHTDINERMYRGQAKLLWEWLKRAKGRRLNIYFGEAKGNRALAPPSSLMKLLVTRSSKQWQDVHIHLSDNWEYLLKPIAIIRSPDDILRISRYNARWPLAPLYPTSLPNLRFFVIHSESFRNPLFDLSLAPSLRSIALSSIPFCILDITKYFPCGQITQLTLSKRRDWNSRALLSLFPRLQSFYCIDCPEVWGSRELAHQELQTLSIRTSGNVWDELVAYIRLMDFPALKTLELIKSLPIAYTYRIRPLIERSKCHLTSLTIECLFCFERDLIDLLFSIHTLIELRIRDSDAPVEKYTRIKANQKSLSRTFFDRLDPDEEAPLLPNLEVFLYKGLLCVQAIDFIEPFMVRSRSRRTQNAARINRVARLKQATIIADQYSEVADFSIADYSDPKYIWEVGWMVKEGVFVLRNMDGSRWS